MDIVSRRKLSAAAWDALVETSPDGWVFSLWDWQELILSVPPWALEDYSFAIIEGRRLLAVVPLQYHPGSNRMASTGWGGSGPVIDGRLNGKARIKVMGQAIQRCIELTKNRGAAGFDISLSPVTQTSISSIWGVNPMAFHGMDDRSGHTQVVDLSLSENDLWAGLSADSRRQIKQARDAELSVERVDWPQHLDHYYELHVATYARTGVPPHPHTYFSGIAKRTAARGNSVLWAVRMPTGEILAYHNACWFGSGAYYHTGCSVEMPAICGASYLLFWEAMLGAKRAGIRWYDCGAIFPGITESEKQRGLSTFKTKFGGQPHRQYSASRDLPSLSASMTAISPEPTFSQRIARSFLSRLKDFSNTRQR